MYIPHKFPLFLSFKHTRTDGVPRGSQPVSSCEANGLDDTRLLAALPAEPSGGWVWHVQSRARLPQGQGRGCQFQTTQRGMSREEWSMGRCTDR